MEQDQDFSALRHLLASTRLDLPQDTQVDQFLADFHHRQRVQLLARRSVFTRATAWMKEKVARLALVPSLSYASAAAAIAITACVGLSQQVQVVTNNDGQSKLTFRMPSHDTSFAMVPASFYPAAATSPQVGESPNFTQNRNDAAATRYVLANNSPGAYDKTVAF
jgi:hypothetical protein